MEAYEKFIELGLKKIGEWAKSKGVIQFRTKCDLSISIFYMHLL